MIQAFTSKDRLLEFYHIAANIIGWVLIGITPFLLLVSFTSWTKLPLPRENQLYGMLNSLQKIILNSMTLGIIVLCVAQFIKYLYSKEINPGWFLRNIDKFLYLFAILTAASTFIEYKNPSMSPEKITLIAITTYLLPLIMFKTAQVLIIIGLAQVLRRILPVIEESKTLV